MPLVPVLLYVLQENWGLHMETFFLKLSVNKWPLKSIAQFLWMLLLSVNPQHHCDTDNVLVGI